MKKRQLLQLLLTVVVILVVAIVVALYNQNNDPQSPTTTPGAGSSWYQVYFTDPHYPDDPNNHHGGLDTHLVELMDKATKTLDVADYDFDLADVADAMVRAQQRGVRVRMVTDTDTFTNPNKAVQAAFATLKAAKIPVVDDQRSAIMHDKFTVVDGTWVETGSWNYTDGDTYHLNNNMIIINSPELAQNYTAEFEKMFVNDDFGSKKRIVPHPVLTIDGTSIQNCFSPGGGCEKMVVQAVNSAKTSIDFLAFSFTDDGIGNAMLARARSGVDVSGVFETTGSDTQYSEYNTMKKAGLAVYTDGNPWSMHHKVIVIDNETVIFGSYNYSESAESSNDENLLIVHNADLAHAFTAEFQRVLAVAKNPPK
ncbi:MAG TPA: phospholipase D-like domain-containing protein [Nitrolancea sp.]|nr:phospholipase D-like domain-containing protein [Nitrolancea sp.]